MTPITFRSFIMKADNLKKKLGMIRIYAIINL